MDKLRAILSVVQKYQFWGLCAIVLVTSLACWWIATSGLAGQFKKRKGEIDAAFNGARIQPGHPNQKVIEEINKQHDVLKQNVFGAWEILYKEQAEKNPFPTKVLGEEFRKRFEELKPKEDLPRQYREIYQNYIRGHLPALLEIIDARRPKDGAAAGARRDAAPGGTGMPGMPGAPGGRLGGAIGGQAVGGAGESDIEWIGIVDWDEKDYQRLFDIFQWRETPSTLTVLLAQEDLWVYEALLRVIRSANDGASGPANAVVKRIESIQIGKDAVAAWKNAENTVFAPKAATSGEAGGDRGGMMPPPSFGLQQGTAEEQFHRQLMENRYVDDKGTPLAYDAEYPHAKHPYAEFKLMPICLNLVIDQRRLPKLLVECANSNMPIEVRRVRVLKTRGQSIDLATATPGATSGVIGGGGPGGRPGGTGMSSAGGPKGMISTTQEGAHPFDVPVEIHAVINIYNPPDREKLGTGSAADKEAAASRRFKAATAMIAKN